jgi:hypothetical protein
MMNGHMKLDEMQIHLRHPKASADLVLDCQLVSPLDPDDMLGNARINSRLPLEWIDKEIPAHDGVAVICGKAPSLRDTLPLLKATKNATIFACNSAAKFLASEGVVPDWQVILDSSRNTVNELGPAKRHLLASVVDPELVRKAVSPVLWHPLIPGIEEALSARPFVGIGGGITVSNSVLCLAYTLGFRRIEVHGMDSSFRKGDIYAFKSDIPDEPLRVEVEFGGRFYESSVDMKQQVQVFMKLAKMLKDAGCEVIVHGSGLLPDVMKNQQGVN